MASRFSFNFVNVEILYNSPLGSGAYGAVYRAKCDKLPCAAKILHSSFIHMSDTLERFRQECDFLESIKHPNIVQFLGLYSDPKTNQTALIMELMDESLTNFLDRHNAMGNVPYHLQVDICHDVVLALHYLHTNEIIHRDLSSNNVLLLGGCIAKVTDLGVSRIKDAIQQQKMTQCPGSPVYMPPEALHLQPVYSEKLDTFSFGVLVIQIQTRQFPNPEAHEVLIADATSPSGFVSMPVKESDRRNRDLSLVPGNPLKAIAFHCIEDMPKQRPTSAELCDKMEELKTAQEYVHSKNSPLTSATQLEQRSAETGVTESAKDEEIEKLKNEVQHYRELVEMQKKENLITSGDPPNSLPSLTSSSDKNVNLEPSTEEARSSEELPSSSGWNETGSLSKKVISNLNPDTVMLLSKSDVGAMAGIVYNQPTSGSITVMANSQTRSQLNSLVRKVMGAYQKIASTPSQLSFVNIPDECPIEEVEELVSNYNMIFKQCSFSFVKDINVIQVVSTDPSISSKAIEQLNNTFRYTMYFSGGRKMVLKKGDITKEDVSVLVTATNRHMRPSNGMCKAVNIASRGKLEIYCEKHVKEHGPLNECDIVTTLAGGDLKCKWVIHALGPDGSKHSPADCQKMTMSLIGNCLVEGNKLKATSIALPAISTGHYHVKTKVAANGIITAVMNFDFHDHHTVRDIRIVIIDDRTFNEFGDVFEERLVDLGQSKVFGSDGYVSPVDVTQSASYGGNCRQQ